MLDLSTYAGQQIEIEFHYDTIDGADNAHPGARIDDIVVNASVSSVSSVPEPGTLALVGLALTGMVTVRRRLGK